MGRFESCPAPRAGVSERDSVGSGLLGVDANGEGSYQGTPVFRHVIASIAAGMSYGLLGAEPEDRWTITPCGKWLR